MMLHDFRLESPQALWALLPVAAAGAHLWWRRFRRLDPALRFSSNDLADDLPVTWFVRLGFLPDLLRILALMMIVLALARPQLAAPPDPDQTRGIDIVLSLDISGSMLAADFQPKDRLAVAKKSIEEFVLGRKSDRVGLVVFAGEAATWVPLTLDYSLLVQLLREVQTGMMTDGTAIGNGIATAINRLRGSQAESKVIILLTDGDSNKGNISPRQAAELAKELGIKIFTILIGNEGPVPFPAGNDLFGRPVYREQVVPTNPKLLEEIARLTGGDSFRATDRDSLDANLQAVLDTLETSVLDAGRTKVAYAELFPVAVLFALILLGLELLSSATRFRRFP